MQPITPSVDCTGYDQKGLLMSGHIYGILSQTKLSYTNPYITNQSSSFCSIRHIPSELTSRTSTNQFSF